MGRMAGLSSNKKLRKANLEKRDEFYTQLSDIENELNHYKDQFRDKIVLCNCDDPYISNFFHYFAYKFETLGLKKLIATCYKNIQSDLFSQNKDERAIYLEYLGDKNGDRVPEPDEIGIKRFRGDGDFRSDECVELLKQADIVVTNPPFSLFREYIAQLVKYDKKFLVIGNKNAITYKEIFKLIKNNKIWTGYRGFAGGMWFYTTEDNENYDRIDEGKKLKNVPSIWFTNLDTTKRHERMDLWKKYTPNEYPKYDYYNAINVDKVSEIPSDYAGAIGVPVTFLDKYNPDQFEILDGIGRYSMLTGPTNETRGKYLTKINDKPKYARIIIKNKELK